MRRSITAYLILFPLMLVAGNASADGAPSPYISDLIQEGQDVRVEFDLPHNYLDHEFELLRRDSDDCWTCVFWDRGFSEEEAVGSSVAQDAFGGDVDIYHYEFIDECVPSGLFYYFFSEYQYPPARA